MLMLELFCFAHTGISSPPLSPATPPHSLTLVSRVPRASSRSSNNVHTQTDTQPNGYHADSLRVTPSSRGVTPRMHQSASYPLSPLLDVESRQVVVVDDDAATVDDVSSRPHHLSSLISPPLNNNTNPVASTPPLDPNGSRVQNFDDTPTNNSPSSPAHQKRSPRQAGGQPGGGGGTGYDPPLSATPPPGYMDNGSKQPPGLANHNGDDGNMDENDQRRMQEILK